MAAETNERIATLESQMTDVRIIMSKREDYQTEVLKSLTKIELKQDQSMGQFLDYQRTCDASREAHHKRIAELENSRAIDEGARRLIRAQAITVSTAVSIIVAFVGVIFGHR